MAYLEAAVVVYLRALYYPQGFGFPLVLIPNRMALIEIGREIATIVMLLAVGLLAGRERWERFLLFAFGFGIWDLGYYAGLRALLGWPPSLLTWDVLFLIPVPWIGPVLAPVIVSLGLILGSLWLLARGLPAGPPRFPTWAWVCMLAGGVFVLFSFTLDFRVALGGLEPPPFRWGLFGAGVVAGVLGLTGGRARR
jgi:hypothetical protein